MSGHDRAAHAHALFKPNLRHLIPGPNTQPGNSPSGSLPFATAATA